MEENNILILFDVDGTLTLPRNKINIDMIMTLEKLKNIKYIKIGFVGGSDLNKQIEQLGKENLVLFDYMFPENGLIAYKNQELFFQKSILDFFGEKNLQLFLNEVLFYLSKLELPQKRGTFIEYRTGLINISPIGRNCTQKERDNFEIFDKNNKIRENMINHLKNKFSNLDLVYSIGGQISFDVFPKGFDKTFCLNHIKDENFKKIYFFGDKTFKGGNDYEIFTHKKVTGFSVSSYENTIKCINDLFIKK